MKALLALLAVLPTVSFAAETVPPFLFSSFEAVDGFSPDAPLSGWSASPTVRISQETAVAGTQSVLLPASNEGTLLARDFPLSANAPDLYIDFYLRPAAGAEPQVGSFVELGVSGLGFVRSSAGLDVLAFNGDEHEGGQWVSIATAKGPDEWLRITIRQDYVHKQWDLYLDDRLARKGLGFFGSVEKVLALGIFGGSAGDTLLDSIYVGALPPQGVEFVGRTGVDAGNLVSGPSLRLETLGSRDPRQLGQQHPPDKPVAVSAETSAAISGRRDQKLKVKLEIYSALEGVR